MSIQDKVAQSLHDDLANQISQLWESPQFQAMGSDIERAFAADFVMVFRMAGEGAYGSFVGQPRPEKLNEQLLSFYLAPQFHIDDYRVDFLFGLEQKPSLADAIVIECDGHAWHEKTKEQAARDKARDRYLSSKVSRVLHFTGSEIYRDVSSCWLEVLKVAHTVLLGRPS